jgi:transposase-like protein
VGEDTELIQLLEDPEAENPAEIVVADTELAHVTPPEARRFVREHLEGEPRNLLLGILRQNPKGEYRVTADEQTVRERAAILLPRIRDGRLLVPKKVVKIGFEDGTLDIQYRQGFSDERVNEALCWYAQGFHPMQIAQITGMNAATLYDWLYKRMDLPRIGFENALRERNSKRQEVLRLYDGQMRPLDIAARIGCTPEIVYETLRDFRGIDFGRGGPDPWVYELTGKAQTLWDMDKLDLRYQRSYCRQRYAAVFALVREFERLCGRGPSRDEIDLTLEINAWNYVNNLVELGVLSKRKLYKEHYVMTVLGQVPRYPGRLR